MTISSTVTKSGPYNGNDVATSFDYSFKIFANSDLLVTHTDALDVETVLVLDTDYTVAGAGDDAGGSITYPISGSPLATGEKLTITSNLTIEQSIDISNQGPFFPATHETAFDKLCRFSQQLAEQVSRSVLAPISSSTLPADLYTALTDASASAVAAKDYIDLAHLGGWPTPPTTLNDGVTALGASHNGIRYWNTTTTNDWTWNGSTWGLTSSSVATSANLVSVADAGGYFTSSPKNAETVLQEVGADIATNVADIATNVADIALLASTAVVSGHVRSKNTQITNGEGTVGASLNVSSLMAAATYESVGKTGSGATNEWAAMDNIPAEATILLVDAHITVITTSASSATGLFSFVHGDAATPTLNTLNNYSLAVEINATTVGDAVSHSVPFKIPLGSNQQFFVAYAGVNGTASGATLTYRGFMTD